MIDERDEMERANPVAPDRLERLVAIERRALLELLEADSGGARSRLRVLAGGPHRPAKRAGYIGAIATAAAAIAVGIVLLGGDDRSPVPDVASAAEELTSTTSTVDDDLDPEPRPEPSTTTSEPPARAETSSPTSGQTTADTRAPSQPIPPDGPFDPAIDLLVLHFDHAHLDDGHAAVAALEIATAFGATTHVVSGTNDADFDGHVHDYVPVMGAAWGDRWLDAGADRSDAVDRSLEVWLDTIDAGGRIWVAEGGVSAFTAEVLRWLHRQRPGLDTSAAVSVVQHSDRNEAESTPDDLRFVRASTDYQRIGDGNDANETADLNQQSEAFEAAALAGRHRGAWSVAFEYLPAAELDFSDTVEVLHIVGVGTDEVADPDGFARRFLR